MRVSRGGGRLGPAAEAWILILFGWATLAVGGLLLGLRGGVWLLTAACVAVFPVTTAICLIQSIGLGRSIAAGALGIVIVQLGYFAGLCLVMLLQSPDADPRRSLAQRLKAHLAKPTPWRRHSHHH
jgi:hypothetical protein